MTLKSINFLIHFHDLHTNKKNTKFTQKKKKVVNSQSLQILLANLREIIKSIVHSYLQNLHTNQK